VTGASTNGGGKTNAKRSDEEGSSGGGQHGPGKGHGRGKTRRSGGTSEVGGTDEERPSRGKLNGCIMHQVHTSNTNFSPITTNGYCNLLGSSRYKVS